MALATSSRSSCDFWGREPGWRDACGRGESLSAAGKDSGTVKIEPAVPESDSQCARYSERSGNSRTVGCDGKAMVALAAWPFVFAVYRSRRQQPVMTTRRQLANDHGNIVFLEEADGRMPAAPACRGRTPAVFAASLLPARQRGSTRGRLGEERQDLLGRYRHVLSFEDRSEDGEAGLWDALGPLPVENDRERLSSGYGEISPAEPALSLSKGAPVPPFARPSRPASSRDTSFAGR